MIVPTIVWMFFFNFCFDQSNNQCKYCVLRSGKSLSLSVEAVWLQILALHVSAHHSLHVKSGVSYHKISIKRVLSQSHMSRWGAGVVVVLTFLTLTAGYFYTMHFPVVSVATNPDILGDTVMTICSCVCGDRARCPKHDRSQSQTKWFLCLDLTRPLPQCWYDIKF